MDGQNQRRLKRIAMGVSLKTIEHDSFQSLSMSFVTLQIILGKHSCVVKLCTSVLCYC